MIKLKAVIKLMRVHQWAKNLFIFLPAFFSLKITQLPILAESIWAFIGFSLLASGIYVFNDLRDIEVDRAHPKKRRRPLASGLINKKEAGLMISLLFTAGVAVMYFMTPGIAPVGLCICYVIMNILYSIRLKHMAIVDILIISTGFVLRIIVGGAVTDTPLSQWIVLMTFLLALFLALAKRRDDILIFMRTGSQTRTTMYGYNLEFINAAFTIMAAVVIVCYIMYTTSPEIVQRAGHNLYFTTFFVIVGIIRYLQITLVYNKGDNPTTILLHDRFIQIALLGWIVTFVLILYTKTLGYDFFS